LVVRLSRASWYDGGADACQKRSTKSSNFTK